MRTRPRVYVASKSRYGLSWRGFRSEYRDCINVTSTWIDESDEGATGDWADLWTRCIAEATAADALIAMHRPGDDWKGAFVEIGAALAAGKPVYVIGSPSGSWRDHPLVTAVDDLDDAVAAITAPNPPSPTELP